MSSYLLFLPNQKGADPAQLDRCGLAELRADRSPEFAEYLGSGLGAPGNLAYWSVNGCSPELDSSLYDWTPSPADHAAGLPPGAFSLGVPKGETITPDGVRRNHVRGGYIVPMADGREWQIPSITHLPHQYGMDAEGQLTRTVKTEFKEFHKQAERYIKQIFCAFEEAEVVGQEDPSLPDDEPVKVITLEDSFAFCSLALSINYRVAASIVAMLALFDDKAMRQVIRAACDVPSLMTGEPRKGPIVGAKETINIPVGVNE